MLAIANGSFGVWAIMMTLTSTILLFYTCVITKEEYSSSKFNYEVSKYLDQCTDDSGYQRYKRTFDYGDKYAIRSSIKMTENVNLLWW